MTLVTPDQDNGAAPLNLDAITGAHHRTLEAIFHHPSPHNLKWREIIGLIGNIGQVHEKSNNDFIFQVAGQTHSFKKPHSKDLTSPEVIELRRFLGHAGYDPNHAPQKAGPSAAQTLNLLIVIDHHATKIFFVDVANDDHSAHTIKPYDPHHFLHHLVHKDQSHEDGQRAPEQSSYFKSIAEAVAKGGKIIVIGHGTGKSNEAHHLGEYLRLHHSDIYGRIVREITCDLSSITDPQLLDLARHALNQHSLPL